jgi:hypothetical protein
MFLDKLSWWSESKAQSPEAITSIKYSLLTINLWNGMPDIPMGSATDDWHEVGRVTQPPDPGHL